MNIHRRTRRQQAKVYLANGHSTEETIVYLVSKKCPPSTAEGIVAELAPSEEHTFLCKQLFVGGIFLSAGLINLIIYTTSGHIHWGALSLGLFIPIILILKLWGITSPSFIDDSSLPVVLRKKKASFWRERFSSM